MINLILSLMQIIQSIIGIFALLINLFSIITVWTIQTLQFILKPMFNYHKIVINIICVIAAVSMIFNFMSVYNVIDVDNMCIEQIIQNKIKDFKNKQIKNLKNKFKNIKFTFKQYKNIGIDTSSLSLIGSLITFINFFKSVNTNLNSYSFANIGSSLNNLKQLNPSIYFPPSISFFSRSLDNQNPNQQSYLSQKKALLSMVDESNKIKKRLKHLMHHGYVSNNKENINNDLNLEVVGKNEIDNKNNYYTPDDRYLIISERINTLFKSFKNAEMKKFLKQDKDIDKIIKEYFKPFVEYINNYDKNNNNFSTYKKKKQDEENKLLTEFSSLIKQSEIFIKCPLPYIFSMKDPFYTSFYRLMILLNINWFLSSIESIDTSNYKFNLDISKINDTNFLSVLPNCYKNNFNEERLNQNLLNYVHDKLELFGIKKLNNYFGTTDNYFNAIFMFLFFILKIVSCACMEESYKSKKSKKNQQIKNSKL